MGLAASLLRAKTSAICRSRSPRRSAFTLMKVPLPAESESTSLVTRFWFRLEAAPGHLGNGGGAIAGASGLLSRQTGQLSRTAGAGKPARYGAAPLQFGNWNSAKYPASSGHHPGRVSQCPVSFSEATLTRSPLEGAFGPRFPAVSQEILKPLRTDTRFASRLASSSDMAGAGGLGGDLHNFGQGLTLKGAND